MFRYKDMEKSSRDVLSYRVRNNTVLTLKCMIKLMKHANKNMLVRTIAPT